MTSSYVLEHAAADPTVARAHFAAKLSVETDPSDVWGDFESGNVNFHFIDVRSPDAYADAHAKGAISFPHRDINEISGAELDKSKLIVVYCWGPACNGAAKAAARFAGLGFQVKEMIGGFEYWVREGLPIDGNSVVDPDLVGKIAL